jgi:hypothetical protein
LAAIDVSYTRGQRTANADAGSLQGDLSRLQPEDVLQRYYQNQYGSALPAELLQAFQTLLLEAEDEV